MRTKEEIREDIRRKIEAQDPQALAKRSSRIQKTLYKQRVFQESRCLFITLPLRGEVDTLPVVERCFSMGKRVVVPKVNAKSGELDLYEIKDLESSVAKGRWRILEPVPGKAREVSTDEVDCFILPGVAFDRFGNRLGRGGGYMDRLLSRVRDGAATLGLAFSFQVMDALPLGPYDRPVGAVLSS